MTQRERERERSGKRMEEIQTRSAEWGIQAETSPTMRSLVGKGIATEQQQFRRRPPMLLGPLLHWGRERRGTRVAALGSTQGS